MKAELLLLLSLAGVMLAGPARRDCGETKTFITTNDCGVAYGGTWVECGAGITEMPTFTVPECSSSPTPASTDEDVYPPFPRVGFPTTTSSNALITPAPTFDSTYDYNYATGSTTCSSLWICLDALAVCGDVTQMYGACYDTCTKTSISAPECAIATATSGPSYPAYNRTVPKLSFDKAPLREAMPACATFPYLCAPLDW
ncbi:hypothetical protein BKA66DRAFT_439491 [Pyrenochaeta sp. MPI-SDFR-AT-0127]|nr:hypothetical protein BKA66DRAFT_439491 [Pyrenochaeta sp. MPI-SDFR-AT-0127]